MQDTILAISGRPGLYRLVTQGRGTLIVETIDDTKKRLTASARDRVTSLNDVSMYTEEDDKPLMEIFQTISDNEKGLPTKLDHKKATPAELADFMVSALPNYDRDRVHDSDIRKLIQWYNILVRGGYTQFVEPQAEPVAEAAEPTAAPAAEAPAAEAKAEKKATKAKTTATKAKATTSKAKAAATKSKEKADK